MSCYGRSSLNLSLVLSECTIQFGWYNQGNIIHLREVEIETGNSFASSTIEPENHKTAAQTQSRHCLSFCHVKLFKLTFGGFFVCFLRKYFLFLLLAFCLLRASVMLSGCHADKKQF